MEFNSELDFLQPSGQVIAAQGDVILAPINSVTISGAPIQPFEDNAQDVGSNVTRWRNIFATSGNFIQRPSVDGSGVLLQGEDAPLAYASYVVNESIDFITYDDVTFTPARWNEVSFEDSSFFNRTSNNERINFVRTGLYKITYAAILQKISSGGGASELQIEINNAGTTIRSARGYVFHDGAGTAEDIGVCTKSFIREFNAGDFIQLNALIIDGGGDGAFLDGTSILIELVRLTT